MTDKEWCMGAAAALGIEVTGAEYADGNGGHVWVAMALDDCIGEAKTEDEMWAAAKSDLEKQLHEAIERGGRCVDFVQWQFGEGRGALVPAKS